MELKKTIETKEKFLLTIDKETLLKALKAINIEPPDQARLIGVLERDLDDFNHYTGKWMYPESRILIERIEIAWTIETTKEEGNE